MYTLTSIEYKGEIRDVDAYLSFILANDFSLPAEAQFMSNILPIPTIPNVCIYEHTCMNRVLFCNILGQ